MANMLSDFVEDDDGARYTKKGEQALRPVERAPYDYKEIQADFLNGENLDSPDGSLDKEVDGAPGADKGNKVASSGQIELVHFGRVYLDAQAKFGHKELDDQDPQALQQAIGGRAIAHRAALQRELVLLGGYLRSLQSSMDQAGKTPPEPDGSTGNPVSMIMSMLGMMGGMLGGPTAPSVPQASTLDTNPLVAEAEAIAKKLDQQTIRYEDLHAAGVALHELRAKYQKFLREQHALLPTGPDASASEGSLTELPFIGEYIGKLPMVGEILGWASKIAGVSFGLCARMSIEMHLQMEGNIEAACRGITVDAIRSRRAPIYDVWFLPPPPSGQGGGGGDSGNPVGEALASAVAPVDNVVTDVRDFFSPNRVTTPGDAFIDKVFSFAESADVWARMEKAGEMGGRAIRSLLAAVDETIAPPIVADVAGYVFRLVSEFLRALYNKLLVLGNDGFPAAALLDAGRKHIVDALIELPFKYLSFMRSARATSFSLPSPTGGADIDLNADALVFQIKKLFTEKMTFLDVALKYAIADVYDELVDARRRAGALSASMEAYLAILPDLHARMFRNLLLPFWSAMEDAINGALTGVLGDALGGATGGLGSVHHAVDQVDKAVERGQDVLRTPLRTSAATAGGDKDRWEKLFTDDLEDTDDPWGESPGQVSAYGTTFVRRKTKGQAELKDEEVQRVAERHEYDPDAPLNEPDPSLQPDGTGDGGDA